MIDITKSALKIGLMTGGVVIAAQVLGAMVVYDFFQFDTYLTIVALSFLAVGHLLTLTKPENADDVTSMKQTITSLSSRELTILKLIAAGNTNKEISSTLSIELSTVKSHVNNIYGKISASNRKEAREKCNAWYKDGLIS